jgi:hypothetical protein
MYIYILFDLFITNFQTNPMGDCEKVESENAALGIFVALLLLQLQILHGVLQDRAWDSVTHKIREPQPL